MKSYCFGIDVGGTSVKCGLFNPLFKKRHIWLIYEKYCISAQDNGFYFFQYCMKHLPAEEKKNIFFILDKSSPFASQ